MSRPTKASLAAKKAWETKRKKAKMAETICPHCHREYPKVVECIQCGTELNRQNFARDSDENVFCSEDCAIEYHSIEELNYDDEEWQELLDEHGKIKIPGGSE